jgi:hypothetical protein
LAFLSAGLKHHETTVRNLKVTTLGNVSIVESPIAIYENIAPDRGKEKDLRKKHEKGVVSKTT